MTDQTKLGDDRHNEIAQRVVLQIESFVETFDERAGSHAGDVIREEEATLDKYEIEQKPERFIVEELIKPVGQALGYDLRFEPTDFDGLNGLYPDFTILNLEVENLGEVKTPGKIVQARKESFEYLEEAEQRPLVGIATDGLTWILYTAGEGEDPQYTEHKRINKVMRRIRREKVYKNGDRYSRADLREEVLGFVKEFHVNALQETI